MKTTLAFFDTKPYDKFWFEKTNTDKDLEIRFFEPKLDKHTAFMAKGCNAVCAFVNDRIDKEVIDILVSMNVKLLAMRCAGYNNIDIKHAYGKIHIARVPSYSPYAVAEHAMAMLLAIVRNLQHSYVRVREFNFSLTGLTGFDLNGKTAGIIGMGRIGRVFAKICLGFGMNVIAYDEFSPQMDGVSFKSLEQVFSESDIISLHCPLTPQTKHIINSDSLSSMKTGAILINTSRGALVDSEALLAAIKAKKIGGAALDVYEEEADIFYEDQSSTIIQDDVLARLISMPNVLVTSHQAFFTKEALENIAKTTLENISQFFQEGKLANEVCYESLKNNGKCF